MIYDLKSIKDADVKNKKVFLRADLDVVIQPSATSNQQLVLDDSRLSAWFPTLDFLLENNAFVNIAGHFGRPTEKIAESEFSLLPVAKWLSNKLQKNLKEERLEEFDGWRIGEKVFLFENLRFYKEEEENDDEFSKKLALTSDIYVNDAFASSHRAHVSIVGVTKYLPAFAGLRLLKEVEELSKVLEEPKRPLCVIIGGAKIETKLPLVEKMHHFADYVLVGGEIAEQDKILLKIQHEKSGKKSMLFIADLKENGEDITEKSVENFLQVVENAGAVVWNGPMGITEEEESGIGTKKLAEGIAGSKAYTVVGGGDTISFLKKLNLIDKFSFVSVGGGAMLEFLAGEKLPGLVVLEQK